MWYQSTNSVTAAQPFREEIDKVVAHYIAPGSPRELNISARDRAELMLALQHTTHPSAFALIHTVVDLALRGCSHPNFIRWSICNGNRARVLYVRLIGALCIAGSCIVAVLLILSKASRWWRVIILPPLLFGIGILVAALKGLCLILHNKHTRSVRPWEQFGEDLPSFVEGDDETITAEKRREHRASLSTFGRANTFNQESWAEKYKKKPVLRKVFDQKTWVQDETVRKLQDNIVLQSYLWSVIIGVPLVALFVALPSGNYY
ncbi:hypothetical protein GP486_005296 [Trichoglossum hirsutum]|uniref:RGS domain-containing protein n=1 Tax=Trichoglossum hirsutum TaxID=265104 RepID=A0A9P8L9I4_9PEZI|nr:hypothetical protein GP486_005296 [Trichoglossum hirsutum]